MTGGRNLTDVATCASFANASPRSRFGWTDLRRAGARRALPVAFALTVAYSARARAEELDGALGYEAPAGCPSRDALMDEVRRRVGASATLARDPRRFRVRITRDRSGFVGRLTAEGRGAGGDEAREIRATTCEAVSTSLAVFLAIALDPTAQTIGAPPTPEPSPPPAPAVEPPPPDPAPVVREPRASLPPPNPPSADGWELRPSFRALYLAAPDAWGARVGTELSRATPRPLSPALRLSWGWVDFDRHVERAGQASFRLRSARLEGCGRARAGRFGLLPCAGVDVGALSGEAPDLPDPGHARASWVAGTLSLSGSFALESWFALEVSVGVLVPFARPTFLLLRPAREAYTPPAVLFEGGLGACVIARFN